MMVRGPGGLFMLSVLVALALQFLPLSPALSAARPLWLAMVLGYWSLYGPNVSVIGAALLTGLACDTLYNTPLGQHVIGLTLLVYTITRLRATLGLYPIWQVTLLLLPAWTLYAVLMFVLDGMAKNPSHTLGRFLPVATSALAWPLVNLTLDALRGKRVSM
jgi:rod shape-determining protein MreD